MENLFWGAQKAHIECACMNKSNAYGSWVKANSPSNVLVVYDHFRHLNKTDLTDAALPPDRRTRLASRFLPNEG